MRFIVGKTKGYKNDYVLESLPKELIISRAGPIIPTKGKVKMNSLAFGRSEELVAVQEDGVLKGFQGDREVFTSPTTSNKLRFDLNLTLTRKL